MKSVNAPEFEIFRKNYSDLEIELSGSAGQPILVVKNRVQGYGCGGRQKHIDAETKLGVLSSSPEMEELDKISALGKFVLPMEKHVEKVDALSGSGKWKLNQGPIIIPNYEIINLGQEVGYTFGRNRDISASALTIETGKNVELYFRFHKSPSFEMGKSLEWLEEKLPEYLKERDMDLSYVEAMDLLNLGEKVPEDFRQRYDGEVYAQKINILQNLEKLGKREAQLQGKIGGIFASINDGIYQSNGAITVCENEDDARVISVGPRDNLRNIRNEIKRDLSRAIEDLGMHKNEMLLELQPGVKMNVPEYISGMWEKYKDN